MGDVLHEDLQASTPDVRIGLSRAGVEGIEKAIRFRHRGIERQIPAEIDCVVDLDPARKGVHMSRFPELFEEAIDEVVIGEALLVEALAEHIARQVVGRQGALRAEVHVRARYPIERRTPVTGLATQEMVTLIGIAAASSRSVRRVVGVEATGINACPCAQGLVRGRASERLAEAGFGEDAVETDPPPRPARHAQPARPRDVARRHRGDAQRRGPRRARRGVDELADLRAAEAA